MTAIIALAVINIIKTILWQLAPIGQKRPHMILTKNTQ